MLSDGHGDGQFQFGSHLERKRRADIVFGSVYRADRIFDHLGYDHRDLDSGHHEIGNGNSYSEPDSINYHLGDCVVLAFDDYVGPNQPVLSDRHGDGKFQFHGHMECERRTDIFFGSVYCADRIFDHLGYNHRDLDSGRHEIGNDDCYGEPGVNHHLGHRVVLAFDGDVRPNQPMLGDGHGHWEFQLDGYLDHKCRTDFVLRASDGAYRILGYKRNGDGNFDAGHDQVRNRKCRCEPDPIGK
jgi:hypothetical protein